MKTQAEKNHLANDYIEAVLRTYRVGPELKPLLVLKATKEAEYSDSRAINVFATQFANMMSLKAIKEPRYTFEEIEHAMRVRKSVVVDDFNDVKTSTKASAMDERTVELIKLATDAYHKAKGV